MTEFGSIDYEDAYMQFIQSRPEELNFYTTSPKFIKAIFNGEIKGKKIMKKKFVYNAKEQLIEEDDYSTHYTFKYNEKGQLTEQIGEGIRNYREELFYNEQGLISKVISRSLNADEKGTYKIQQELDFAYTFY